MWLSMILLNDNYFFRYKISGHLTDKVLKVYSREDKLRKKIWLVSSSR